MKRTLAVVLLGIVLFTQLFVAQNASQSQTGSTANTNHAGRRKPSCSDDGTYQNSKGQTVKRPENCSSAPQGASAQCRDGTYSFSRSRRGTCSHHGGVAKWL